MKRDRCLCVCLSVGDCMNKCRMINPQSAPTVWRPAGHVTSLLTLRSGLPCPTTVISAEILWVRQVCYATYISLSFSLCRPIDRLTHTRATERQERHTQHWVSFGAKVENRNSYVTLVVIGFIVVEWKQLTGCLDVVGPASWVGTGPAIIRHLGCHPGWTPVRRGKKQQH